VPAGITGFASGGISIVLAAMASGGMDTLPHDRAIITLLAVRGMTRRRADGDIFRSHLMKTAVAFGDILLYYALHLV
jgi:H+/gluconate symporter-like permease